MITIENLKKAKKGLYDLRIMKKLFSTSLCFQSLKEITQVQFDVFSFFSFHKKFKLNSKPFGSKTLKFHFVFFSRNTCIKMCFDAD